MLNFTVYKMYRSVLLIITFVSNFVSYSHAQTAFDSLVDEVLWEAEQSMVNESKTNIIIPDIDKTFDKKILFFNLKGNLRTSGGKIGNLSTIERIGDVNPVENNDLTITALFGMKELGIHFDKINVDFLFFHFSDGIDVKINKNSMFFNVTFHYEDSGACTVILNEAKVTSLGEFRTTIIPKSFLHSMAEWLITSTLDIVSTAIKNTINAHLTSQLNSAIQKLDLCSKLPFSP